jgi:hypothetical protein
MNPTKSLLLIALFSCLSYNAIAQPIVTSSNMFVAGDMSIAYIADTTNVDYGTGGANKTWDYSGLKAAGGTMDSIITRYIAPSETPYHSNFPDATLCSQIVGQNTYSYMKYDNSASTLNGIGFTLGTDANAVIETYDQPELYAKFPINSTYNVSNTFSATYISYGITSYRRGSITMRADGYGTLKLPRNTYNNVLRIYTVSIDSADLNGSGMEKIVSSSYTYQAPGIKNDLLKVYRDDIYVKGMHVNGNKHVTYYDMAKTGISRKSDFADASVKIFPNPVQNLCTLSVETDKNAPAAIDVINALGQVVKTYSGLSLRNGTNSFTIDMSTYEKGFYFVRLSAEGQSTSQKILVQ